MLIYKDNTLKWLHLQYSETTKYNANYIKTTCYAIEDYSDPTQRVVSFPLMVTKWLTSKFNMKEWYGSKCVWFLKPRQGILPDSSINV